MAGPRARLACCLLLLASSVAWPSLRQTCSLSKCSGDCPASGCGFRRLQLPAEHTLLISRMLRAQGLSPKFVAEPMAAGFCAHPRAPDSLAGILQLVWLLRERDDDDDESAWSWSSAFSLFNWMRYDTRLCESCDAGLCEELARARARTKRLRVASLRQPRVPRASRKGAYVRRGQVVLESC